MMFAGYRPTAVPDTERTYVVPMAIVCPAVQSQRPAGWLKTLKE